MRHLALVTQNTVVLLEWRRKQASKSWVAYSVVHHVSTGLRGRLPEPGFQALGRKWEGKSCRIYLAIW